MIPIEVFEDLANSNDTVHLMQNKSQMSFSNLDKGYVERVRAQNRQKKKEEEAKLSLEFQFQLPMETQPSYSKTKFSFN